MGHTREGKEPPDPAGGRTGELEDDAAATPRNDTEGRENPKARARGGLKQPARCAAASTKAGQQAHPGNSPSECNRTPHGWENSPTHEKRGRNDTQTNRPSAPRQQRKENVRPGWGVCPGTWEATAATSGVTSQTPHSFAQALTVPCVDPCSQRASRSFWPRDCLSTCHLPVVVLMMVTVCQGAPGSKATKLNVPNTCGFCVCVSDKALSNQNDQK